MPFLHTLLQKQVLLDTNEAMKYALACGLSLEAESYTCLIVFCLDRIVHAKQLTRYEKELPDICIRFFRKLKIRAYAEADGCQTMILLLGKYSRARIEKLVNSLYDDLEKHVFPESMIAVGRCVTSLADVRRAFQSVQSMIQYYGKPQGRKVLFCEDLSLSYQQITLETGMDAEQIIQTFISGDMAEMRALLEEKAEALRAITVRAASDMPYPSSIRRTMVEIALMLMHIASDAGVDVESELGNSNPYQIIFEMKSTPEIIDWMIGFAEQLNKALANLNSHRNKTIVQQIKDYIQQHIDDPCLSLDMASAHIGLSASYFSSFFIRETGTGFRNYVNMLRIDKAKKLLMQKRLTNAEIARRCGFSTESYFISVFKKYVHVTPKAYQADACDCTGGMYEK